VLSVAAPGRKTDEALAAKPLKNGKKTFISRGADRSSIHISRSHLPDDNQSFAN